MNEPRGKDDAVAEAKAAIVKEAIGSMSRLELGIRIRKNVKSLQKRRGFSNRVAKALIAEVLRNLGKPSEF